jgi:hypothetical protein
VDLPRHFHQQTWNFPLVTAKLTSSSAVTPEIPLLWISFPKYGYSLIIQLHNNKIIIQEK